jgi:dynein heavy chain
LRSNFKATVPLGLNWIRTNDYAEELIKTTDLQQVVSIANFLEYFVDPVKGFKGKENDEKKKILDALFAFAYAWGIGGSLSQTSKERFDTVVRDQFKAASIPSSFTVFDYFYDLKKEKAFRPWQLLVKEFEYNKDASFFDLLVPTQDTVKYAYLLELLMMTKKPLFFTGNSGIGKSVIIQNTL